MLMQDIVQKQSRAGIADDLTSILRSAFQRVKDTIRSFLEILFTCAKRLDNRHFRSVVFDINKNSEFLFASGFGEKYVVNCADRVISRAVYSTGAFEFDKVEKALSLLGADFKLDCIVDIGSNIGTICIPLVKRGLAKAAIAIEPEPKNFRLLMANIYLNDLASSIKAYNFALGARDNQTLKFELSEDNAGDHRVSVGAADGSFSERNRKVIEVPSHTFDSLGHDFDEKSTLIWMDTQGYEGFVLSGARKVLLNRVPLVIEFWPYGMQRANSYPLIKDAILRYRIFYDLTDPAPKPIPLTEDALDRLYRALPKSTDLTDLLLL